MNQDLPRHLFMHISQSKTDRAAKGVLSDCIANSYSCGTTSMQLHLGNKLLLRRNIKNPELCPLIALMIWLTILK